MEIALSNEEIRALIKAHQNEIQKALMLNCNSFELNPIIAEHKAEIDKLRAQCNHLNPNHEIQTFNGYCIYCGTKM